ncbi:LysR family transcriptional regulator, benzoate and cis,cis-muconate-responsive activator of ben and cat genes (plasmid) [Ensifer sp. WSM1721]|uniref:LysR family transcriptional regulator n=1 Tax=Ensifer sp. WSM1721 TaxID=1041159 RepID=UPI00047D8950|nr:LysR substrate-binding domain-containing protein [Ensifer sp. WSM1721]
MDFKRLSYFLAVAEELHFGRASARLGIAQPPLSRQIAQFEKEIGAILFDRSRSQIRLTQAGELLQERAREILERVDQTEREVKRIGEGVAGRLRIAFVGTATFGVLPNIIKAFRVANPDIELALSAMNNAELKRALIQREIDIAAARPAIEDSELKAETLIQEPLVLALPDVYADFQGPMKLEELRETPFVLFPRRPRPSYADYVLDVCKRNGFIPASQVMAQDFLTAISLVSVGVGVCVVPQSVALNERTGVVYRNFEGFNPGTKLSLNYRRDNRSPHLFRFLALARKLARM